MEDLTALHPRDFWRLTRTGEFTGSTAGVCQGYVQSHLIAIPRALAFEFLLFCQRNPLACPVLDVTEPGALHAAVAAPEADLRTDSPLYRVYRYGRCVNEPSDVLPFWRDDLVTFLLGCGFTADRAFLENDIPIRHIEENVVAPVYVTTREVIPAGVFRGPLVVAMRPVPYDKLVRVVQVTTRFPIAHGAPIHIGDPALLGIQDLSNPTFGDAVTIKPGEVPVFWACGVTPHVVLMHVAPDLVITQSPGHMFVTSLREEPFSVL